MRKKRLDVGKEGNPTSISAGLTGTVRIRNATLRDCIVWAYDVPGYLIFENDQLFPNRYAQKAGGKFRSGREILSGEDVSMKDLAGYLAVLTNRPVLDTTSIAGAVTFKLTWRQPQLKQRSPKPDRSSNLVAFMTALQEQLGLKLIPQDSPIDMLVVDHAEPPMIGLPEPESV